MNTFYTSHLLSGHSVGVIDYEIPKSRAGYITMKDITPASLYMLHWTMVWLHIIMNKLNESYIFMTLVYLSSLSVPGMTPKGQE